MKKNIVIVFLILVSVSFVIYAQIKTNEAEKAVLEAIKIAEIAAESHQRADIEAEKALQAATEAKRGQAETERIRAELLELSIKITTS